MYQLKFSIQTLSPIIMSSMSNSTVMTKTHAEFSGSIIRGILASRYLKEQNIKDNAHEKPNFIKLFYGDLKFLPANPECQGQRSFVLPLSLQQAKPGSKRRDIQDMLKSDKANIGYKSLRGYGIIKGQEIQTTSLKMNIFMHMSRSSESERLSGKSIEGKIYNYESINKGQKFQGLIIGSEENLNQLLDGLNLNKDSSMTAYAGRSRFTQYGKCKISFDRPNKIDLIDSPVLSDNKSSIYLRLDTPLISTSEVFINADEILFDEIIEILNESGGKFSLGKVFSSGVEIENFLVPWNMKRPRTMALAAGSVFELKKSDSTALTNADLNIIVNEIYKGFGERTEEGFGQLRIWNAEKSFIKAEAGKTDSKDETESTTTKVTPFSGEFSKNTKEIAAAILNKHFLDQIRIYANDDAEKLRNKLKYDAGMTHFFSRLEHLIDGVHNEKNVKKAFQEQLKAETKSGTLFDDYLKKVRMANGRTFYDVLTGLAELPYKDRHFIEDVTGGKYKKPEEAEQDKKNFETLLEKLNINLEDNEDNFYFEYLKNYFKFARKISADEKGGVNE